MNKRELAQKIDHAVLGPLGTQKKIKEGLALAEKYNVASYCVMPHALFLISEQLKASVKLCTVIGFPQGGSTIKCKLFEIEEAIKKGAKEIDVVVNIANLLSNDWKYIENEVSLLTNFVHEQHCLIKVIFGNAFLSKEQIIRLSEICSLKKVDFIKTSTGYDYIKNSQGKTEAVGALLEDIRLMRQSASSEIKIKASGGIKTYQQVIQLSEAGADRIGTSSTQEIIETYVTNNLL